MNKHKISRDSVLFILQIAIMEAGIFLINLASVGFDINKIRWFVFGATFFISLYAKIISTRYATSIEVQKPRVADLETSIYHIKKSLYENDKMPKFNISLKYRNIRKRISADIDKMDNKLQKTKIKDGGKYQELVAKRKVASSLYQLLANNKFKEFEELSQSDETIKIYRVNSLKKKYGRVSSTVLFTNGIAVQMKNDESKYFFNKWASAFKNQVLFIVASSIMSIIATGLTTETYFRSWQLWVDFLSYTFSLMMGLYNGFNIGKDIIVGSYVPTLESRLELIDEVIKMIPFVENKIEAL